MPKVVIADTSCFIVLSNINELDLLQKVYGEITTTAVIASEFGNTLPEWVTIKSPKDIQKQKILELQVDKGKASAIALAMELDGSVIVLDDLEARTLAKKLGITVTGTLGVLVRAKLNGSLPMVKPLLDRIKQTNFRISPALEFLTLKEAGE
jgi:predicted nucleic acid-binding protein